MEIAPRRAIFRPAEQIDGYGHLTRIEVAYNFRRHPHRPRPPRRVLDVQNRRIVVRQPDREQAAIGELRDIGLKEVDEYRKPGEPSRFACLAVQAMGYARDLVAGWRVEAEGKLIRPAASSSSPSPPASTGSSSAARSTSAARACSLPELLAAARRGETHGRAGRRLDGHAPRGLAQEVRHARRPRAPPRTATSASAAPRPACSTPCSAAQPEIQVDAAFEKVREQLHQLRGGRAARRAAGLPRRAPPLPARGPGLARLPPASSTSAASWPTTWAWARRSRCSPCSSSAGAARQAEGARRWPSSPGRSSSTGSRRPRGSPRGSACSTTPAPTAHARAKFARVRPDHHHLRHPPHRHRRAQATFEFDYVILDEAQAIKNADSQAAKAARLLRGRAPPGDERHADREPPGRALVDLRVPQPRHARRRLGLQALRRRRRSLDEARPRRAGQGPAAVHPPPHQGAGRQGPPREDRADPLLRHGADAAASSTTSSAAHYRDGAPRARIDRPSLEPVEDRGPRGAAAAPPGRLPPRPDRPRARSASPAPSSTCSCRSSPRSSRRGTRSWSSRSSPASWRSSASGSTRRGSPTSTSTAGPATAQARVERFQTDPDCPIFLISLKAGGLGLNLTAAEYVYLLDPWWNPAVEAQAIDRSHRIGQTQHVFAYRLICRDTVEEKILELQQKQARPGRRHPQRRGDHAQVADPRRPRIAAVIANFNKAAGTPAGFLVIPRMFGCRSPGVWSKPSGKCRGRGGRRGGPSLGPVVGWGPGRADRAR